jgi:hypothetical protein
VNGPKSGTGLGCTSAEGPTSAAGAPGAVRHRNLPGIPYESSPARTTTNDSPERTTNDSSARASTGQHTPTPHTGTGAGSDNAEPLQRPVSPAPAALSVPSASAVSGSAASFSDTAGEHSLGSQLVDGNRPTANVLASPALLLAAAGDAAATPPLRAVAATSFPYRRRTLRSFWRLNCRPSSR